jgi:hypothetical protein
LFKVPKGSAANPAWNSDDSLSADVSAESAKGNDVNSDDKLMMDRGAG